MFTRGGQAARLGIAAHRAGALARALFAAGGLFGGRPCPVAVAVGGQDLFQRQAAVRTGMFARARFGAGGLLGHRPLAPGVFVGVYFFDLGTAAFAAGEFGLVAAFLRHAAAPIVLAAVKFFAADGADMPVLVFVALPVVFVAVVAGGGDGLFFHFAAGIALVADAALFGAGRVEQDHPIAPVMLFGRDGFAHRLAALYAGVLALSLFGAGGLLDDSPVAEVVVFLFGRFAAVVADLPVLLVVAAPHARIHVPGLAGAQQQQNDQHHDDHQDGGQRDGEDALFALLFVRFRTLLFRAFGLRGLRLRCVRLRGHVLRLRAVRRGGRGGVGRGVVSLRLVEQIVSFFFVHIILPANVFRAKGGDVPKFSQFVHICPMIPIYSLPHLLKKGKAVPKIVL